jgi:hypothetical protein
VKINDENVCAVCQNYENFSSWCIRLLDLYLDPPLNADPDPDTAIVLNRILLKAEIHYDWRILISTTIKNFRKFLLFYAKLILFR